MGKVLTHPCRRLGIDPCGSGTNYRPTSYENCLSWSILPRNFEFCSKCDSPWKICFVCAKKGGRTGYQRIQDFILSLKLDLSKSEKDGEEEISKKLFLGINGKNLCCFHALLGNIQPADSGKPANQDQPLPLSREEMAQILFPQKSEAGAPVKIALPSFGPMTEKARRLFSSPRISGVGRTVSNEELEKIRLERENQNAPSPKVRPMKGRKPKQTEPDAKPNPAPKNRTIPVPDLLPEEREFLFLDLICEIAEKFPGAAGSSECEEEVLVQNISLEFPLNKFAIRLCLFFIRLDESAKKSLQEFINTPSDEALTFLSFCRPLFDLSPANFEILLKKIANRNPPISREDAKSLIMRERLKTRNDSRNRPKEESAKEAESEIIQTPPKPEKESSSTAQEPARSSGGSGRKRLPEQEVIRREEAKKARKEEREKQKRENLQKFEKAKEERKKQLAIENEERRKRKDESAKLIQAQKQERGVEKARKQKEKELKKEKAARLRIQKEQQKKAKEKLIVLEAANAIADSAMGNIKDLEEEKLILIFFGNGSAPEESAKAVFQLRTAAKKILELLEPHA